MATQLIRQEIITAKWSLQVERGLHDAQPIQPTFVSVDMFRLSVDPEGEEQLAPRPTITKAVTVEPAGRPTKFVKKDKLPDLDSDEALEAFFRQEDGSGWTAWRDEDAWEALLNWAVRHNPQPESRRQASRMLGSMLLLRVGVLLGPLQLDYEGPS
jgi:hypothetical protein